MAKLAAKSASRKGPRPARKWPWIVLVIALAGGAILWVQTERLGGTARAATSYGAHVACSCRHIGGRPLDQCTADFEPGMEAVFLSEDAEEKSVTAYIPLIESNTATYREGYGCQLDPWEG